ncbi:MAG: AAA family ATPase, partial [Nitrosospira sp.]
MRIEKLFLSAFGPFTDHELDFAATPANFHLIYGPNEAGKSSALRAMGDLRFGIHPRSTDNFIHDYNCMQLGGVFANTAGERIALARRKGNKQTLLYADPENGKPIGITPVASAVEHALTGGLDRKQFEVMFGIDHERLREGGKLLLSADGELGSALFEASAGTRGVTTLLASLQEDSRRYFIPRSKQAVLNEASLQIDEYKRAYRQALTRPAEWRDRQRAHADAKEKLAELRDQLFKLRRRENELTELRAVQPLLKHYDDALAALEDLAEAPLLSGDARESRLAAEQSLKTAQKTISQAEAELAEYAQENAQLMIEPVLLRHAAAVERLVKDRSAASYTHVELRKIQAEAESTQRTLVAMASRIAGDRAVDDVLAAIPSMADRVMLDENLVQCNTLEGRLSSRQEQVTDIREKLQRQPEGKELPTEAALRQAIEEALHTAHAIGDFTKRHEKLQGEIKDHALWMRQGLTDLGLSTVEQLQGSQLLLAADIISAENEFGRLENEINRLDKEETDLKRDLKAQQRRQHELAAAGEVVTAQTLRTARVHRDHGWDLIRKAFIERSENAESLA